MNEGTPEELNDREMLVQIIAEAPARIEAEFAKDFGSGRRSTWPHAAITQISIIQAYFDLAKEANLFDETELSRIEANLEELVVTGNILNNKYREIDIDVPQEEKNALIQKLDIFK